MAIAAMAMAPAQPWHGLAMAAMAMAAAKPWHGPAGSPGPAGVPEGSLHSDAGASRSGLGGTACHPGQPGSAGAAAQADTAGCY